MNIQELYGNASIKIEEKTQEKKEPTIEKQIVYNSKPINTPLPENAEVIWIKKFIYVNEIENGYIVRVSIECRYRITDNEGEVNENWAVISDKSYFRKDKPNEIDFNYGE